MNSNITLSRIIFSAVILMLFTGQIIAQENAIDFDSDQWEISAGKVIDYMGRKSLYGTAILKDVEFENGIIEVDIAITGARSYPGLFFRVQDEENSERFYVRPHRMGLYPDAMQYTPHINGISEWQITNGKGCTGSVVLPKNEWVHLKMEVKGSQAKVYLNDAKKPNLVITNLKHGISNGTIGVNGPANKTAMFSNFRYTKTDDLEFDAPPVIETPEEMLVDWDVSVAFQAKLLNRDNYPRFYTIFNAGWEKIKPEPGGLINIARLRKRTGQEADAIMARTNIYSEKRKKVKLEFGYSDRIDIFHNGQKIFEGTSAYQYRDKSFLGIVGFHDAVHVTLEKGLNEIYIILAESFGGWGFKFKANQVLDKAKHKTMLTKVWETPKSFATSESAVYDKKRKVLYVSSFDNRYNPRATKDFTGYISKVNLDGEIEELKLVSDLFAPCGLGIYKDKLYTVERKHLTEIDIKSGKVVKRYPIPGVDFPNDLTIDKKGNIYISDTRPSNNAESRIYRFHKGKVEEWYNTWEIHRANGMYIKDNKLYVGNSGDGTLKTIDIETKKVENVITLGAGIIDGIRFDNDGNLLVSHWEGQTYLITPGGDVTKILDTLPARMNSADFEFISEQNLLIIPTFSDNGLVAYRLNIEK